MDKFLVSSPTQLSQPFEVGSDNLMHLNNIDLYQMEHQDYDHDDSTIKGESFLNLYNKDHASLEELVPASNNNPYYPLVDASHHFSEMSMNNFHQKNPSLDHQFHQKNPSLDHQFHLKNSSVDNHHFPNLPMQQPNFHRANLSISSQYSVNQDPPSAFVDNHIHNLHSTNTLYLVELVPPLLSSISNQLLLDLPQSFKHHPHHKHSPSHSNTTLTTPARMGRNKLASFSSNNNLYSTPLRNGAMPAMSPVNLLTMTNSASKAKIAKHTRLRSRISIDASNLALLTHAAKQQNLASTFLPQQQGLNPFYTPLSFISPKVGTASGEIDDIGTPLQTPNASSAGTFKSNPYTHTDFSPIQGSVPSSVPGSASTGRNDNLDSIIRIEEQDDDAFKQLRKAKSYSNFMGDANSKLNMVAEKRTNDYFAEDDELLMLAVDLSVKLEAGFMDDNLDLRPEASFYSHDSQSMSHLSAVDLVHSLDYMARRAEKPKPAFRSSLSIDLLSLHIVNRPPDLKRSATFTKSYPASNNLASLTNPQMNYTQGLLPPMATFPIQHDSPNSTSLKSSSKKGSVSGRQSIQEVAESIMSSELKLPIKVADNFDNVDPKKRHPCPLCQARFQRPEHVKRHLKSHSSEKPYQCEEPDCGKRFNRKDNLKAHLKKIHHKV